MISKSYCSSLLSEKGLAFLPILESIKEWKCKYEVATMPKVADAI
jgi:DNA-binding HxlR family transcriptional regulator